MAKSLPTSWGGFLTPAAWQTTLRGRGWSSPIVIGNRIWLTTAESVALTESKSIEKLVDTTLSQEDFQVHRSVRFFAIELELETGKVLREIELLSVDNPSPIHVWNSYASPTPTSDGQHLYCHFGSMGTIAIDMSTGKTIWCQTLSVDDVTGPGSSPMLYRDSLIIPCDGADEQYVIALDKRTGLTRWKSARPPIDANEAFMRRAFSTSIIVSEKNRTQVIIPTARWLVSYDPETGREWWRCRTADGYSVIPQPAYANGIVYTATGYMRPELWAIRIDGTGDVSETHVVWKHKRQAPEIASPIVVDNHVYCVSTGGVLSCLAAGDGELRWQQRLPGDYAASPIYADGKLYLTNQSGVTTVIEPGAVYKELAQNETFGRTQATMAISGQTILLRTDPVLYAFR